MSSWAGVHKKANFDPLLSPLVCHALARKGVVLASNFNDVI